MTIQNRQYANNIKGVGWGKPLLNEQGLEPWEQNLLDTHRISADDMKKMMRRWGWKRTLTWLMAIGIPAATAAVFLGGIFAFIAQDPWPDVDPTEHGWPEGHEGTPQPWGGGEWEPGTGGPAI